MAELADENQKLKARLQQPQPSPEEARGRVDNLVARAAPSGGAATASNARLERFRRAREADTPFRVPPGPFAFDI